MKPIIFLAEDNPADVFLVRESFNSRGLDFELMVAEDGEAGIAMIERFGKDLTCPHIAVLDLNLPRVEGTELLELLRDNEACAHLPVLVVSSSRSPKDRQLIEKFGARYFCKPSELSQYMLLADVILEMIGQRSIASESKLQPLP